MNFRALVDSQFSLHVLWRTASSVSSRVSASPSFAVRARFIRRHSELTWKAIDGHYMSRENFQKFFEVIFSAAIPAAIQEIIKPAEDIRDKLMHGRGLDEGEVREPSPESCITLIRSIAFSMAATQVSVPSWRTSRLRRSSGALDKARPWILKGNGVSARVGCTLSAPVASHRLMLTLARAIATACCCVLASDGRARRASWCHAVPVLCSDPNRFCPVSAAFLARRSLIQQYASALIMPGSRVRVPHAESRRTVLGWSDVMCNSLKRFR